MGKIEKKRNSIQRRLKFLQKEKKEALSWRKFETGSNSQVRKKDVHRQVEQNKYSKRKDDYRKNRRSKKLDRKRTRSREHELLTQESVDFCERADQPPVLQISNKSFLKKTKKRS